MSNIIIKVFGGNIVEVATNGLHDKVIVLDYDSDPKLDLSDIVPSQPDRRMTEEEENLFKY